MYEASLNAREKARKNTSKKQSTTTSFINQVWEQNQPMSGYLACWLPEQDANCELAMGAWSHPSDRNTLALVELSNPKYPLARSHHMSHFTNVQQLVKQTSNATHALILSRVKCHKLTICDGIVIVWAEVIKGGQ